MVILLFGVVPVPLMVTTVFCQVDSLRERQETHPGGMFKRGGRLDQERMPVLTGSPMLDSLLEQYPELKRAALAEVLVGSYRLPVSADEERTIAEKMADAARLTPFEAMSLAAKRQQEIRGPTTPPPMGLNLIGLIEWLMGLFR